MDTAAVAGQPAAGAPPGSAGGGAGSATNAVDILLARMGAELEARLGDARAAADACARLVHELDAANDSAVARDACSRLGGWLATAPNRPAAQAVFETLQARALASGAPAALYDALLQVRERPLRSRAITSLGSAVERELALEPALLQRVAAALADATDVPPALGAILAAAAAPAPVQELLRPDRPPWLRALAARCLDADGHPAGRERWVIALGRPAADRLAHYLAFTRASHVDLVRLGAGPDGTVPLLESIDAAEHALGVDRLARLFAELGWSRVALGVEVSAVVQVRILGGFPAMVRPAEAALLEECGGVARAGEADLVVAHGIVEEAAAGAGGALQAARIRRFRDYNVAHAELLNEILEVGPITAQRARSMLARVAQLAADFAWLFAAHDEEAAAAPAAADELAARLLPLLLARPDATLGQDATRLVQGFEDPASLDGVTTLHGLKRYLHQRGLRNAFRLFQSGASANRSVDLAVMDRSGSLRVARRIRYVDFEPSAGNDVPPIVRAVVDGYARWVVHGSAPLPDTRLLIYAHEVQLYLSYRAHPAFVRLDLSPPRRGGMIDLEYFAVSQNDLEQHPARNLAAIQAFLRRIGFFVTLDGLRIHARYDKERAFDRADILEKISALVRLTPLLMDLDWTIGSLAYPRDATLLVQAAWSDFFERHGVLPLDALLTADRTRVLCGERHDAEEAWDGIGAYRDRFPPVDAAGWWLSLAAALERHHLAAVPHLAVTTAGAAQPGQCELDRRLLQPLRAAQAAGGILEVGGRLRPADASRYRVVHEAARFAALLDGGGKPLEDAARLGAVVRNASALFRFRTTGTVQGYRVERADLALSVGPLALFALCDAQGSVQLAFAVVGSTPAQARDDASGEWRWVAELGAAGVIEQLLRDNYVSPSPLLTPLHVLSAAEARELFAQQARRAPRAPLQGDRVVEAEAAAPGRAAGVVRTLEAARPDQLRGGILAAPVVRAEDALALHAAAGIVTTGGGILSHAALLALEMRKPSVLLRGAWQRDASGAALLALARTEYREQCQRIGACEVVCWETIAEHIEELRDGDLIAIDADEGSIRLLGQDRVALALHHGLADLDDVARGLVDDNSDHAIVLELRGRLLRALHALQKLLRSLTDPALAHHAARELVIAAPDPPVPVAAREKCALLELLLANPAVGPAAAAAAAAAAGEMRARFEALVDEATSTIPVLARPVEIIFLRHAVVRLAAALRVLGEAHGTELAGLRTCEDTLAAVNAQAVERLLQLRATAIAGIDACTGDDSTSGRLPHVQRQVRVIDAVIGSGTARLQDVGRFTDDRPTAPGLRERLTVSGADGGFELGPLIGNKAAGLGEMERILAADAVPAWFALTDRALRRMLDVHVAARNQPRRRCTLRQAIDEILARTAWDPSHKAAAIADLWREVAIPADVRAGIESELSRLADGGADAAVAIRSSSFEEDQLDGAWAGQFSTFLNITGTEAVLDHVKQAWAALWNERALYRRGDAAPVPGGGLIVQRMIDARAAGVLHTASVAAAELRTMVANVGLGLGAGVVSGEVGVDEVRIVRGASADAPIADVQYRVGDKRDQYVADPAGSGIVLVETVYHQRFRPALEYSEVFDLAGTGLLLESVLGHPLDIEFAFEGEHLRVLQVRPIPVFYQALTETLRRFPFPARP